MENNQEVWLNANWDGNKIVAEKGLWNPKYFAALSFFFSFFPAAILYAFNYGRLGNIKKRNLYLIGAIVLFAIFIDVSINYAYIAKYFLSTISVFIGYCFYVDQRSAYELHIDNGGKKASYLIPILAYLGIVILIIVLAYYLVYSRSIEFENDRLYYTKNMNVDDVEQVGRCLMDNKVFKEDSYSLSLKIDKNSDKYILYIPVKTRYLDDEQAIKEYKLIGRQLSKDVFDNKNVELDFCDAKFRSLRTITID